MMFHQRVGKLTIRIIVTLWHG